MSKTLETLFQSKARVKLLKFLFRNNGNGFAVSDISKRIRERPEVVRREIKSLSTIGLIIKK